MNTSGIVLFAKAADVVAKAHEQFRQQQVQKQYLALCMGTPSQAHFAVDIGITDHPSLK